MTSTPVLHRKRGRTLLLWLALFLVLDVCTTMAGLGAGLHEMNPLVGSLIGHAGLNGLLLTKVVAMAFAGCFLYSGRLALLRRVTVLMGVVVSWNLFWLVTR